MGSKPIIPPLPGIDKPHVHWAADADSGKVKVGKQTVVVGAGAVGVECAIQLKSEGHDVTIVEMAPDMLNLASSSSGATMELTGLLDSLKIPVHLGCKLESVTDSAVVCIDMSTSKKVEFPADTVLLALGVTPNHAASDPLRHSAPEVDVYLVGDAKDTGNVGPAIMSAFKAAAYI